MFYFSYLPQCLTENELNIFLLKKRISNFICQCCKECPLGFGLDMLIFAAGRKTLILSYSFNFSAAILTIAFHLFEFSEHIYMKVFVW